MASPQSFRLSCIIVLISGTSLLTEQCENDDLYAFKPIEADHLALDATEVDQVRIKPYTGADTQLWKFQPADKPGSFFLINEHHRKALDFNKGGDGHFHVVVNELEKSLQQQWNYDFNGRLVNAVNGKHVDITGAKYFDGNHLILWEDNGCVCQEFILVKKKL